MHLIVMLRKLLFAIIQSFFILGSIKIFSNKKIWVKLVKYFEVRKEQIYLQNLQLGYNTIV